MSFPNFCFALCGFASCVVFAISCQLTGTQSAHNVPSYIMHSWQSPAAAYIYLAHIHSFTASAVYHTRPLTLRPIVIAWGCTHSSILSVHSCVAMCMCLHTAPCSCVLVVHVVHTYNPDGSNQQPRDTQVNLLFDANSTNSQARQRPLSKEYIESK